MREPRRRVHRERLEPLIGCFVFSLVLVAARQQASEVGRQLNCGFRAAENKSVRKSSCRKKEKKKIKIFCY